AVVTPSQPAATTAPGPLALVFDAAVGQVGRVLKPEAAAVVAVTFGFPLVLNVAVVLFLLVQGWVDARDPKLRVAPRTATETVVAFQDEEQL
ncbi:MAG TPA: hypothetical protein VGB34_05465, partial [Candidatus Limnocylindria bacterium]